MGNTIAGRKPTVPRNAAQVEEPTLAAESTGEHSRSLADALRPPALPGAYERAKRRLDATKHGEACTTDPMFSTRPPPPSVADGDWQEC